MTNLQPIVHEPNVSTGIENRPTGGAPVGPPPGWQPPKPPKPPPIRVPLAPNGYLRFRGKGLYPRNPDTFTALCGDNPPTITGGYAKWDIVSRPLRRGLTVFTGFEPAQMKVEIRFGTWDSNGWDKHDKAGRTVEHQIELLEWMAGSNFVGGPSPYVYASSLDANGVTTPLIPLYYQQTTWNKGDFADTRPWPWIINGGIEWGESVRNEHGWRIRQDATFTLMNFQGLQPVPTGTERGGYFISRAGMDTPLLIAEAPSGHSLSPGLLAKLIVSDPKNKHLKLRGVRQHIKIGRRVWVPAHVI